jgi:hypothetical protein
MNVIHPTPANENPGNFNPKSEIRNPKFSRERE